MPVLDEPKWELFAQFVARGFSLVAAYEKVGYEGYRSNASRLMSNPIVHDRVVELQELAAKRTLVTIDRLTEELEDARELAMKDEKGASAAVSAVMAKAKLHGLDVTKVESKGQITVSITSDDAAL